MKKLWKRIFWRAARIEQLEAELKSSRDYAYKLEEAIYNDDPMILASTRTKIVIRRGVDKMIWYGQRTEP